MRDPGKVRPQMAELSIDGMRVGLVIIDEFWGLEGCEQLHVTPQFGGLIGDEQPRVVQFAELDLAGGVAFPRSPSARPWLRAKKGRARQ